MAAVPENSQLPSVMPQTSGINVRATPEEAGALTAEGLEKLGAGSQQAGKFFGQMAADDATTTYVQRASDINSKLRSLSGADALHYLPQAKVELDALYNDTRDSLSTADSMLQFDQATKFYRTRVTGDVDDYGAQQTKQYGKQVNGGLIATGNDLAARAQLTGDQTGLQQAHSMMRDAYMKNLELEGLGDDPTLRQQALNEADRQYSISRLTAAIGSGDTVGAKQIWDTNQANLVGAAQYDRLGAAVQSAVGANIAAAHANPQQPVSGVSETGGGVNSNNIGNVKTHAASLAGTQAYVQPATPEAGVALAVQNLHANYKGLTLAQIGAKWDGEGPAKAADWAANVSAASGIPVDAIPNLSDPHQLQALVRGIGTAEKSPTDRARFTPDVIQRGVQAGLSGTSPATGTPTNDLIGTYQARVDAAVGQAYRLYPGNDAFADKVRAETETRLNQQISEQTRFSTATRLDVSRGFDNAQAMMGRGLPAAAVPSNDDIARAYPTEPDQAQALIQMADQMRQTSRYLQMIPGATPEQIANIKRQTQPDPAHPETFAKMAKLSDALDAALANRAKALRSDPASYVISNQPSIAALFDASRHDGRNFSTYETQVIASQTEMGVPAGQQHILPQYAAQAMARDLSADPASTQRKLSSYAKEFGPNWPAIFRDVSTIGGLSAQYQSIALLPERDGFMLSRVLATGKEGKDVRALMTPQDVAAIHDNLQGHMHQFQSSLAASQIPPSQIEAITNSAISLAHGNAVYGSMPPDQAADAAFNAFTSRYGYIGVARVPADRRDVISQNAQARLDALTEQNVAIPHVLNRPGAPTGQEYLGLLRSAPTWITSPQGDSIWLMDTGGKVVRDRRGNPISVPFNAPPPPAGPKANNIYYGH